MEAPEDFSVAVGFREGYRVLVVRGELDELTAHELEAALNDGDGRPVIVDVTHLSFISSAGIHVLLRDRGRPAALVCPPGNIARPFEIVHANRRIAIFHELDHAVQSLSLSLSRSA